MLHSSRSRLEEEEDVPVSSDEELVDEEKHQRLVKSIGAASGKSKKQRKQSRDVSALNPGAARDSVPMATSDAAFKNLKNKIKEVEDPLPKHKVEALERKVAYSEVCEELDKWDPIIKENRRAPQLIFPSQRASWSNNYLYHRNRNLVPRTPLELELAACLEECKDDVPSHKTGLTPREQRHLKTVSAEQAKAYLQEVRKHRQLLSYKEAKDKWKKKIKSKRWLKRMRKTRVEREAAELAALEKTDKKAFEEKMKEFAKLRMQERMSLKHRGSNKFRKKQKLFAKYDDKVKMAMQEMLEKGRELTDKIHVKSDSEEEDEEEFETEKPPTEKPPTSNIYTKPQAISNKELIEDEDDTSDEDEPFISETLTRKRTLQEIEDEEGYAEIDANPKPSKVSRRAEKPSVHAEKPSVPAEKPSVPAEKPSVQGVEAASTVTFQMPATALTIPDALATGADSDEEIMTMEEALATEDIKEQFAKRKEEIENKDNPKDINTYVPGWNDWGGPGITVSKKKLKRFTIRARKRPASRKSEIGHVIFHNVENPEAEKHRVKSVPFPFTSKEQFERSLQHPVGRIFNTELAHRELCKPRVVTKLGTIIKPMNKEEVFQKRQQQQKQQEEQQEQGKQFRKQKQQKQKQQNQQQQKQQQQKQREQQQKQRQQQQQKGQGQKEKTVLRKGKNKKSKAKKQAEGEN